MESAADAVWNPADRRVAPEGSTVYQASWLVLLQEMAPHQVLESADVAEWNWSERTRADGTGWLEREGSPLSWAVSPNLSS